MTPALESELRRLPLVLDVGGWFKPLPAATHVVDLLPYETRFGRLTPEPLPDERFSKATWTQCDFLQPGLRLPYVDSYFDFAYCGHTIEDLADPVPLLRELPRVARAGEIRCPSRLSEQTRGVRDRMCSFPGHPHHHWIVDISAGRLRLCSKADSLTGGDSLLPLTHYERAIRQSAHNIETVFAWKQNLPFEILRGAEAACVAVQFVRVRRVSRWERVVDASVRRLRQFRHWRRTSDTELKSRWWREVLAASRQYSTIPLPE